MKTRTRTLIASLCILAFSSAMANDAVWVLPAAQIRRNLAA